MWLNGVRVMAETHILDWKRLGFSFLGEPGRGTDPIDRQLAYWEHFFDWAKDTPDESHPIIEASLKWLKENRYAPGHVALCWGDPKLANLMFDDDYNVKLAMDWEMAYISDPESDLSFYYFLDWQHTEGAGFPRLEGIPDREETNSYWEEITGYKVMNLLYNDVLAACRFGVILVSIFKNFRRQGVPLPDDIELNNASTQRLAMLLGLEPPAARKAERRLDAITFTVQVCFTGPSGFDWYLVSDKGKVERHEGLAEGPDCTLRVSIDDWKAIGGGDLKLQDAWTDGRCKVEGDTSTMLQLKDKIIALSGLD
jgi:putative sterol carrier protein